jgi:hypothetical protein
MLPYHNCMLVYPFCVWLANRMLTGGFSRV